MGRKVDVSSCALSRLVALTVALFVASACASRDIAHVATTPTGEFEARVIEVNPGATSTMIYEVHIVPASEWTTEQTRVAMLVRATRNRDAYGVNVRWQGERHLQIQYFQADDVEIDRRPTRRGVTFEVVAIAGVVDDTAPPGAMVKN